uniref:Monocyte differentiation antigen CD14 n=1 Tax=Capra hircus TaxID=9925 RepID=Q1PBC9_CAPHI|nr:CD14 [Capra hircus]
MVCVPYLLLLLLSALLRVTADKREPCELDPQHFRCVCNFTDPKPDWSSAVQCMVAVEVEIRGGGHSLDQFLKGANTDPKQYADTIKALRVRRLKLGAAQVPAQLLVAVLRALGYSRLKELTLEDLEVTGPTPPAPLEATGPALTTLSLRNVSGTTGGAWLGELQPWLKPGLRALNIAQAHSLAFPCAGLSTFEALTTLDLSDNPSLGDSGLMAALCPNKFRAPQYLALRNAGMEAATRPCAPLAAARVQPQNLDLSHNSLRVTAPGATRCVWPSAISSLNCSFAGLEQVPKGLPPKLSVLDLSCNKLSREPRRDELPYVNVLTVNGNPFLDPGALQHQNDPMISRMIPDRAPPSLVIGVSGALVLYQGARGFA